MQRVWANGNRLFHSIVRSFSLGLIFFVAQQSQAQFATNDVRTFDDANLHAVQFLDASEGWAVGDLGTVWHTENGGKSWDLQPTGTRATLTAISMRDHRLGFIASRSNVPYCNTSTGMLITTENGGLAWKPTGRAILPGLMNLQFIFDDVAVAVGETTNIFPFGLFFTKEGPEKWIDWSTSRVKMVAYRANPWTASRFLSAEQGVLGTADGRIFFFGEPPAMKNGVPTHAHGLQPNLAKMPLGSKGAIRDFGGNDTTIFAVGDQASVYMSADAGTSWTRNDLAIDPEIAKVWNFNAVSVIGNNIWIAGRPGSVVARSRDAGKTWTYHRTPSPLPIRDMCFVDEKHGWAVGAMGLILGTVDGGENWAIQQQGSNRAAAMCVQYKSWQTPLTTVARIAGEDGYQCVAVELASPDTRENPNTCLAEQLAFADGFRAAGGTVSETMTRFPLANEELEESTERLIKHWDTMHEGKAVREIERDLVLAYRIYRPAVVITENTDVQEAKMQGMALTGMAARRAYTSASNPNAYPEQLEFFGLKPASIDKLYGRTTQSQNVPVVLRSSDVGPHLGATYADFAEIAAAAFEAENHAAPVSDNYVLLKATSDGAGLHKSLMQGTEQTLGNEGIRRPQPVNPTVLDSANKGVALRRELAEQSAQLQDAGPIRMLLVNNKEALSNLDELRRGQLIFSLARDACNSGRYKAARNFYLELIRKYPNHPLTLAAFQWVISYYTSSEMLMFARRTAKPADVAAKNSQSKEADDLSTDVNLATDDVSLGLAIELGEQLKPLSIEAWSDPRVQICLIAANRKLVKMTEVEKLSKEFLNSGSAPVWGDLVQYELSLFGKANRPTRPAAVATYNDPRFLEYENSLISGKNKSTNSNRPQYLLAQPSPVLDGDFSDLFWNKCAKKELTSKVANVQTYFPTEVMMRYDADYIYIAATCKYPSAKFNVPMSGSQKPAIGNTDRLEIILDTDRDYTTAYHITLTQAGDIQCEFAGNHNWMPRMNAATSDDKTKTDRFVQQTETGWNLEARIPIVDLASTTIMSGDYWGINILRYVPNQGTAALSLPATKNGHNEGMTTVRFMKSKETETDSRGRPLRAN